jgi:hypothetical protein
MTHGMGIRSMICATAGLVAVIAALALPAVASATPLSYTFDTDSQGWGVSQNSGQNITPANWSPIGGNPGGHLTATDTGADSGCPPAGPGTPCYSLFFESPALAVGGLTGNYGGTASFDLRSSVSPGFASELIFRSTSLQALVAGVVLETSGTTYHHLSIPLTVGGAAWQYCTTFCVAATEQQFRALLASADSMAINADVSPSDTGETYALDNVSLTDGPPQAAPVAHKKCKKKKHRAAAAKKKCKKKGFPLPSLGR